MKPITAKAHKNLHKASIYAGHAAQHLVPSRWLRHRQKRLLRQVEALPPAERQAIWQRVHYYNRLTGPVALPEDALCLAHFQREKSWSHHLDLVSLLRYFPRSCASATSSAMSGKCPRCLPWSRVAPSVSTITTASCSSSIECATTTCPVTS
ncbi:MAG: hypothetical protein U5L98_02110 [Halomonas sp.]|uniref:hypothetical protein n=1 Tax=Halomonas sp. TaxID=1486246 RepID=UPI002ACE5319|nr:hypothetical protein [Halomonas sp.]MDZ7851459.1 hypothetical protein [Halomonas sp.]